MKMIECKGEAKASSTVPAAMLESGASSVFWPPGLARAAHEKRPSANKRRGIPMTRPEVSQRRDAMKTILALTVAFAGASPVYAQDYFQEQQERMQEQRENFNRQARERQQDQVRQSGQNLQRNYDRNQQYMIH
jgi:hypothetical protein